jgi:cellulose synthase/poly-beta-1,6-N-acetylglucosamine synthase-like glycosyltransferase
LAAVEPRLTVISTPDSKSKARNVNYALTQLPPIKPDEFEIVSVMDADHLPKEDVYEYVLSNFENRPELDIVQGRCVIRNVRDTWVSRVISVEFDMIYNLYHVGRTLVSHTSKASLPPPSVNGGQGAAAAD